MKESSVGATTLFAPALLPLRANAASVPCALPSSQCTHRREGQKRDMADEADRLSGRGDYEGTPQDFSDDPEAVAAIRPLYHRVYGDLGGMSTVVSLSADGTRALGLGRDGFTYGETALSSVWRVLCSVSLDSYTFDCSNRLVVKVGAAGNEEWIWRDRMARCEQCGRRPAGASIVDLGSGVGNVVTAAALLASSGALMGGVARLDGVELLPTLHAAGQRALECLMHEHSKQHLQCGMEPARGPGLGVASFPLPLPSITLTCEDLESYQLADCDVVYMASTVFDEALLARFAERAAKQLRPGCRVVTLAEPLHHPAFTTEAVVPCVNSWGEEDALINLRMDDAEHRRSEPGSS